MRIIMIGLGGVCGALARYWTGTLLNEQGIIPLGTLAVNLAGCFILSFFLTVALHKLSSHGYFVLAFSTGFAGSLTTFSTLSAEGIILFHSDPAYAWAYLGLTLLGGYLFTWAGFFLGHFLLGTPWGVKWARVESELKEQ